MNTVTMSTPTPATSTSNYATPAKAPGTLDSSDFLKLLAGQMQNQDPMNPSASMDIGQMAQMATVEQLTNLAASTQQMVTQSQRQSAVGLIGHTVSYVDPSGTAAQGTVQSVELADGKVSLTIDGRDGIDPDSVGEVS